MMFLIHAGIAVTALFLAGLLLGYMVGKHVGAKSSESRVRAVVVLELREQVLRKGVCPTCDRSTQDMVQYGTKG